jgi:hypothetical protein
LDPKATPAVRVRAAADFVFACLNKDASHDYIEQQLQIPFGSLGGVLISDRILTQRYQVSMVENSNGVDRHARQILRTIVDRPARAIENRALLNYVGSLRCQGERLARLSENLGKKVIGSPDREDSKAKAKQRKLWDNILGAHGAYPPSVEVTVTAEAPLAAAKELLPQLEAALEEQKAAGQVSGLLAEQVRRVTSYIKQREGDADRQRRMQELEEDLARWRRERDAEQPGREEAQLRKQQGLTLNINLRHPEVPAETINQAATPRPTITDEYLAAHPEERYAHEHEHGGQITVDLLRRTLMWVEAQTQTPLRVKQAASLRGRIKACDLDAIDETEDAEETELPGGAVTSTAGAPLKLNISLRAQARPAATPEQTERNERLKQLRAQITMSRRDTRGLPSGAAGVLHLQELEERLAELEGKMS